MADWLYRTYRYICCCDSQAYKEEDEEERKSLLNKDNQIQLADETNQKYSDEMNSIYKSRIINESKLEEVTKKSTAVTKIKIENLKGCCYESCYKCLYPRKDLYSLECSHKLCASCLNKLCIENGSFRRFETIKCPRCYKTLTKKDLGQYYDPEFLVALQNDPDIKRPAFECAICLETFLVDNMKTLDCDHRFCNDCLKEHLTDKIMSGNVKENVLLCPSCKVPVDIHIIQACVDAHTFERFNEFALRQLDLDENEVLKECPFCKNRTIIPRDLKIMNCLVCKEKFCPQCNVDHKILSCEEYQRSLKPEPADFKFEGSVCPKCKNGVVKESGCNFMRCAWPGCKTYFCLLCNKQLTKEDHYTHYATSGPYSNTCNTLEANSIQPR